MLVASAISQTSRTFKFFSGTSRPSRSMLHHRHLKHSVFHHNIYMYIQNYRVSFHRRHLVLLGQFDITDIYIYGVSVLSQSSKATGPVLNRRPLGYLPGEANTKLIPCIKWTRSLSELWKARIGPVRRTVRELSRPSLEQRDSLPLKVKDVCIFKQYVIVVDRYRPTIY